MNKYLVFESKEQAERIIPLRQIRKIKIDSLLICLAHSQEGFIAFEKDCPHMSDDLSRGHLNNQMEVVCPWHTYRFNLINGDEAQNRCKSLMIYRTIWENNQLFVIIE
jgi:nitrite reductase/ring-hydroxylating ferredoxin subunit